jgi:formylglycine-generating enzyme required for sulfatase activity
VLPPVSAVPAGSFLMGSDPQRDPNAQSDEMPQSQLTLGAFQMATYPVTVAEYSAFVRSGHAEPAGWSDQLGNLDHPVVYVSWNDAVAYAAWLAKLTGQPWRLPTEAEWEKAARGADGRIYPWGDSFDASRAKTDEGDKGGTTPVGSYPTGASPYGAQDMIGNVFQWTSSIYRSYPYSLNDGRETLNSTDNRVLRGGTWVNNPGYARAAYRIHNNPVDADFSRGFRLALAVPNSG